MTKALEMMKQGVVAAILSTVLVGCATVAPQETSKDKPESTAVSDPLEPLNRTIYGLNEFADIFIIGPLAAVYDAALPDPVQDGVRNVLRNLETPLVAANQVLQGNFDGAGQTVGRFGVNTTAGVLGIFDVAETMGMPYQSEDFGKTLGKWGVGSGPYLVLPLLGPSNLRDACGVVVESVADPVNIYANNHDMEAVPYVRMGLGGMDARVRADQVIRDLRRNSLDSYAAVRDFYGQARAKAIHGGEETTQPEIPDYAE